MSTEKLADTPRPRKGRITQDRAHGLLKRSRLLTKDRAIRFARCQAANKNVAFAEVKFSREAKGAACYYVQWRAQNKQVADSLYDQFQLDRIQTAEEQYAVMSFYPVVNQFGQPTGQYAVVNDDGHGEQVHLCHWMENDCDCSDFRYRCLHLGARCHHLIALDRWLSEQREPPEEAPRLARTATLPPERTLTRTPGFDYQKERERDARLRRLFRP